jgi:monothiol glutaredoxin|tara:strand:+ start:7774 stop:8094 length:321 start_codon:yes stop_codon:yes gene_type:complete
MREIEKNIKEMIDGTDVLLFMKGDPYQPKCGFSARVIEVLKDIGKPFGFVDILADQEVRATLPSISDWPTFPQLFIKGELIGGCDIITEMHEAGELAPLFEFSQES